MIRKLITTIITLWVLVTGVYLLGANYYQKNVVKEPFKVSSEEEVRVQKGESLYSIINSLEDNGKLKNSILVRYYIKKNKITAPIRPGTYKITKDMSLREFIASLGTGNLEEDPDIIRVTIPEGFDLVKIGQMLENKGLVTKDEFLESCKQYTIPDYVKKSGKRRYAMEGFLFPDTYEFRKGTSAEKIIEIMSKRFEAVIASIEKDTGISIDEKDLDKIITMASVVEKEIEKPDERGLAASVFYNRLARGMKLESCATVIYALGAHKDKLLNADLKVQSPYNTYLYADLPEGPICSPGRASIEAAMTPAQTAFLFFVSKNDGSHHFSETFSEHQAATRKYQN
jgi:UPF0755 protein